MAFGLFHLLTTVLFLYGHSTAASQAPYPECQFPVLAGKARYYSVTERRADWLGRQGFVGVAAEIGGGQEISSLLLNHAPEILLASYSRYDMSASSHAYEPENQSFDPEHFISLARLKAELDTEYLHLAAGVSPDQRKFVVADTVSTARRNGHGWLGFKGQLTPGSEPITIMIQIGMQAERTWKQKEHLGILGTNLVYCALHDLKQRGSLRSPESRARFIRSLLESLPSDKIDINAITVKGGGKTITFSASEIGVDLLAGGATKALTYVDGNLTSPYTTLGHQAIEFHIEGREETGHFNGGPGPVRHLRVTDGRASSRALQQSVARAWREGETLLALPGPKPESVMQYLNAIQPPRRDPPSAPASPADPATERLRMVALPSDPLDRVKLSIIDVGGNQAIASFIHRNRLSAMLYETEYFRAPAAARSDYPGKTRLEQIARQLDQAYARIDYFRPHRKVVLATNLQERGSLLEGLLALKGQTTPEGKPASCLIRFQIQDPHPALRHAALARMGTNLLHAFYQERGVLPTETTLRQLLPSDVGSAEVTLGQMEIVAP